MKIFKKGQSAMEYLMTYGWAIIIVIIVAAALVALGIFDVPAPEAATGFEIGAPTAGAWSLEATGGTFTFRMTSSKAYTISITEVNVTNAAETACTSTQVNGAALPATITPGQTITVTANCSTLGLSAGSSYNLNVGFKYDNPGAGTTGLRDSGKVSGPVSE